MSTQTPPASADFFNYLRAEHLPEAHWIVGGGFRFDHALLRINDLLKKSIVTRQINEVYATLPLRWSLSWYRESRVLNDNQIRILINNYSSNKLPLALSFDNPFVTEEQAKDSFGYGMIEELLRFDKHKINSVFVASDLLANQLRTRFPKLNITCHVNRLNSDKQKRSPKLYQQLLSRYNRVTLHPNDALKPSMYEAIEEKSRCIVIVNDPCLKNCPVRQEHLRNLSQQREAPYAAELRGAEQQLITRMRCQQLDSLVSGQSSNLSIQHMKELYRLGYRNFAIQAERFHFAPALLWDIFHSMFTHAPEHSNKIAVLRANAIANLAGASRPRLKSGMPPSSLDEY